MTERNPEREEEGQLLEDNGPAPMDHDAQHAADYLAAQFGVGAPGQEAGAGQAGAALPGTQAAAGHGQDAGNAPGPGANPVVGGGQAAGGVDPGLVRNTLTLLGFSQATVDHLVSLDPVLCRTVLGDITNTAQRLAPAVMAQVGSGGPGAVPGALAAPQVLDPRPRAQGGLFPFAGTAGASGSGASGSGAGARGQSTDPPSSSGHLPGNVEALARGPTVVLPFPGGNSASQGMPKLEKWTGDGVGVRGSIWLATYEGYCGSRGWDPAHALTAFVSGKALEWWYSLQANATAPLTWAVVRAEFLSYFDPQRRTMQTEARAKLMAHECTMVQFPTVKCYEQEFRRLCREVGGMTAHEQVAWFIHGCTPALKRQCATRPDGSEWTDLNALVQFAIGVETRNEVAAAPTHTSAKRPRLAAAASSQEKGFGKQPVQAAGGRASASKSQGTRKVQGQKGKSKDDSIPGRLQRLWGAAKHNSWPEGGPPYSKERFMEVIRSGGCVVCAKPKGTGPGTCPGHVRPVKPGGASGSGATAK